MVLPFRIVRYRTENPKGKDKMKLDQAHARMIRSIEDFVRAYANATAIGRTYFIGHETLGYVILSTYMSPRIDMNCANNGLTYFDVAKSGEMTASSVYISGHRVDKSLITYNVFTKQYRAWEEWMNNAHRIKSREIESDMKRTFELSYTERATLRVLRDNEKSVKQREDMTAQREKKFKEMQKIMLNTNRNGKIYAVCSEGGRGKTSTSIHTAGAFASLGKRVLLVDLDGQRNATCHLQNVSTNIMIDPRGIGRFCDDERMEPVQLTDKIQYIVELNTYVVLRIFNHN